VKQNTCMMDSQNETSTSVTERQGLLTEYSENILFEDTSSIWKDTDRKVIKRPFIQDVQYLGGGGLEFCDTSISKLQNDQLSAAGDFFV